MYSLGGQLSYSLIETWSESTCWVSKAKLQDDLVVLKKNNVRAKATMLRDEKDVQRQNGIGYTDFIWVSMVEIKYKILAFYSSWAQIDASQEVTGMK